MLRLVNNLAVVDDQNRLVFFLPEPGPASIGSFTDKSFNAPVSYTERCQLAQRIVDNLNTAEVNSATFWLD